MAKRFIMRIELNPSAKAELAKLSNHHGMTQVSMMSRLVEFCTSQSELIQAVMVGRYPGEIQADVAELILKRKGK